jgi:hypothetical protein
MPGLIFNEDDKSVASSKGPAFITDVDDESITNIFCFGSFADKHMGIEYNNCTGEFPLMSLNSIVFFL